MDCSKKGALAELIAAAWLMKQGYEVFRNVSASGAADLVAWNHDASETLYIDVKTATRYVRADGQVNFNFGRGNHQEKNIKYLLVCDDEVVGYAEDRAT